MLLKCSWPSRDYLPARHCLHVKAPRGRALLRPWWCGTGNGFLTPAQARGLSIVVAVGGCSSQPT